MAGAAVLQVSLLASGAVLPELLLHILLGKAPVTRVMTGGHGTFGNANYTEPDPPPTRPGLLRGVLPTLLRRRTAQNG